MALMRVYCGLAATDPASTEGSASSWLTVSVVDDAGRLLDVCDIADDPTGYAQLGALLAERSGGANSVAVAADSDEHQVTLLIAAAGGPLTIVDDELLADYADRFADDESPDEIAAGPAERNAVGLARALQAGALAAESQAAPRELMALKPVLAAHASVAAGRHSTAVALREVLRELYPAALRAYPDPAEPIPLAILDALPEPGLLGAATANRGRDANVAMELAATGLADAATITDAITALRVAIAETPRRTGIGKGFTAAVTETIRQAVAAVRACDAATIALVGLLIEKMPQRQPHTPLRGLPRSAAPVSAAPVTAVPMAAEPARAETRAARRRANGSVQPVSPAPVRTTPPRSTRSSRPAAAQPAAAQPAVPAASAVPAAPPRRAQQPSAVPPQQAPIAPVYTGVGDYQPAEPQFQPPGQQYQAAGQQYQAPAQQFPPPPAAQPSGPPAYQQTQAYDSPSYPEPDYRQPQRPEPTYREPSHSDSSYGEPPAQQQSYQLSSPAASHAQPPSWDHPSRYGSEFPSAGRTSELYGANGYSPEAPANGNQPRVNNGYEQAYPLAPEVAAPGTRDTWPINAPDYDEMARVDNSIPRQRDGRVPPPWLTDLEEPEAPPLRVADPEPTPANGSHLRLITNSDSPSQSARANGSSRDASAADGDEPDDDLLIFAQMASAWFTEPTEDDDLAWSDASADEGWTAAMRASEPSFGEETSVGLPRRVPQANLVPGSPLPPAPERSLRIVRDPAAIAAHTTGYFRGSRRGEEVRGYAVGGRPGRESASGWDFSRDNWESDRDTAYRSAAHR